MFLSVFDVFKIGIGPSSSHTMGPMTAANRFLDLIASSDWPRPANAEVKALKVSLHGSLAYTGIGHGTGRAVVLGLTGERPDLVDPDLIGGEDRRGGAHGHRASRRPPRLYFPAENRSRLRPKGDAAGSCQRHEHISAGPGRPCVAEPGLLFHRRRLRGHRSRAGTDAQHGEDTEAACRRALSLCQCQRRCWPWQRNPARALPR